MVAKLTYIKSQCRVRCELTKAECLSEEEPPQDLFERARKKLEAEVCRGGNSVCRCPTGSHRRRSRKNCGVVDNFKKTLKDRIAKREPLNGLPIAQGTVPKAGGNPFLKHSYQQAQQEKNDIDAVQVDMRTRAPSDLIKEGALIATIGFSDEAVTGVTVLGDQIPPPLPPEVERFKAGENTVQKGLDFFAAKDGIPKISGETVSVEPAYSYDGDVNLASGDLNYQGNVVINGSIDVGATVTVFGNLKVAGEILEATVFVSGDLTVDGGIITGSKGKVVAKGDVKAKFLDNSSLLAGKSLTTEGNLVGSTVRCGGDVKVGGESGLVFGGSLRALGKIQAQNLGRSAGDVTEVKAGFDWYWFDAVKRRSARIKNLRKHQKLAAEEHERMLTTPLNKKIEDKIKQGIAASEKTLKRYEQILEKAEEHLEAAKGEITHNETGGGRCFLASKAKSATSALKL